MKKFLFLMAWVFMSGFALGAERFTAEWLENGCRASVKASTPNTNLDAATYLSSMEVSNWIGGAMYALDFMSLAEGNKNGLEPNRLAENGAQAARSILDFIEKNKINISPSTSASVLLGIWYLGNHPDATLVQRALAAKLTPMLRNLTMNQRTFPTHEADQLIDHK